MRSNYTYSANLWNNLRLWFAPSEHLTRGLSDFSFSVWRRTKEINREKTPRFINDSSKQSSSVDVYRPFVTTSFWVSNLSSVSGYQESRLNQTPTFTIPACPIASCLQSLTNVGFMKFSFLSVFKPQIFAWLSHSQANKTFIQSHWLFLLNLRRTT